MMTKFLVLVLLVFVARSTPQINSKHSIIKQFSSITNFEKLMYDSTQIDSNTTFRKNKPMFLMGGLDGLGMGTTIFGMIDVQVSSLFLLVDVFKVKVFLLSKNLSPFVGLNIGKERSLNFGGGGESNEWTAVLVGLQFYPFDNRGFFEFALQFPTWEQNKEAFQPTLISFTAGIRLF